MRQPHTQNRKGLLITAVLLLLFRPFPPIGVYLAIILLYVAILSFWGAFFPKQMEWLRRKMEVWGKGTDDPNEPARWVP